MRRNEETLSQRIFCDIVRMLSPIQMRLIRAEVYGEAWLFWLGADAADIAYRREPTDRA